MIAIEYIRSFFPPAIARESRFDRYMLKEYLQLLILDHLATTPYINKVSFIGGTNLRLIQGIDRFSEDLDFDCKELSEDEFMPSSCCRRPDQIWSSCLPEQVYLPLVN